MRAAAYQRSDADELLHLRSGSAVDVQRQVCEADSVAKKKSGPWPAQAVPSFKSLASKVAVMASRSLWTTRFGERGQLHRVCFFSGSGRTAEAEREQRCKDSTAEYNCDCATH